MGDQALAEICEVLKATQLSDATARKAAEQRLDEASSGSPNQLVQALISVLAAGNAVAAELRQEASIILRQLIEGLAGREPVWQKLEAVTQKALMTQLFTTIEFDTGNAVKRNAGQAASAIATSIASELEELVNSWPEFLPVIAKLTSGSCEPATRVVAIEILRDLVSTVGEGFMENSQEMLRMIESTITDTSPEVRAAAAALVLKFVEILELENVAPLAKAMEGVINTLTGLSNEMKEEPLKDTLQALTSAIDAEPEFFKQNGMQELWPVLVKLASVGANTFVDEEVRHGAMESAMSLALGLCDDFSAVEKQTLLEHLINLNMEWMLEVEQDVNAWTTEGKDDDEDKCDDEVVCIAEENFDRIAETFDEDVFMPLINKVIRTATHAPNADWRHARAACMAISQVVEHIDEEAYVDQCVEFIAQNLNHAHPRVRYSAFWAIGQISYDHSPHVQENHDKLLLSALVAGIKDENIRVATSAVNAFTSFGEDLDGEDLAEYTDDLLTLMFAHLNTGDSRTMQEHCLSGIAIVAEAMEEYFAPYYSRVIPMLKQVITNAEGEKNRSLRGKAFECVSIVGSVVDKEMFAGDAHEVMQVILKISQAGFEADDPQRESIQVAAGKIAKALKKDFKSYVPGLLPTIFNTLKERPVEVDPGEIPDEDDEDDLHNDMSLTMVGDKLLGLKTTVLEEMKDALELANTFIESLEEDFCEFMPQTCQNLLPLLEFQLSEDLRKKAFKTWELLAECAQRGVKHGRIDKSVLQELVTQFLRTTLGAMAEMPQSDSLDEAGLGLLQARAIGVGSVIRKAGEGVLTKDSVKDVANIVLQILNKISCAKDESSEPGPRRRKGPKNLLDDDDDEQDENEDADAVTRQTVRFSLADVAGALMWSNSDDFVEVALQPFMQVVQALLATEDNENDRSLAFYITDDAVDCLGERSIPYWNAFMNQALQGMSHRSAVVRQYAFSTIGNGARQQIFAQMVPAAASSIHKVLQKQGEKHRRRRPANADAEQTALAVEACIKALGEILEYHEQQLGTHAGIAWGMWISNLPLKNDQEEGQKVHKQLLRLVSKNHPVLTSPDNMPKILTILADVYKTNFSTTDLDKEIRAAFTQIGEASLTQMCGNLTDKQKRKVEHIVRG